MTAQTEIRIGHEFVGYRLDDLIGRGGMGVVYRAYDLRLRRTVALKLMAPDLALDQGFRERFSREAELAMSLEHPNVVPIHDAGDIDGRLYLAMRHVEGTDLRALLHAEGPLDEARAVAICSQVANALDAAHAKGLVHRDVKPSNVLLDAGEHVYLADFGLTRRLDQQGGPAGDHRSVGTPAYLAPEQIEGGPVDGRTDVYSLGCLLYQCLTGNPPFAGGSRLAVAWAHLEEEPPSASERRPVLPEAIDAVIRRAMAKEPADRYPTCAALITAAEGALGLRRPPTLLRRKVAVIAALASLVVLAGLLGAAVVLRGTGGAGGAPPDVTEDSLVRINPTTNKIMSVVSVPLEPVATAFGGRSLWVYTNGGPSISEIDGATGARVHTTWLTAPPVPARPSVFGGPVLAADAGGAWLIGVDRRGRPYLTRVFSGPRALRKYRLEGQPRAVAVDYGAVWVVVHSARDNALLRIDPATGKVTRRTPFPRSSPIDTLAAGLGHVWVLGSSTAMLYRINPQTGRVTGRVDLGQRAGRPTVVHDMIWVSLTDSGGQTAYVDPRRVRHPLKFYCCAPEWGSRAETTGSAWSYDAPTGTVVRWDAHEPYDQTAAIHITDPPTYGGPCLTSIAAGAGAVWVTTGVNSC